MAPSDHNQGQGSFLERVSVFGAAGAILIAILGLLGYVPTLGLLGSLREDFIPMAPSTAVSFIVLGGILLAMALRPISGARLVFLGALAALVSLFGALEVAAYFTGRDLNFEDALVPNFGHLGKIPVGRMSPATGVLFFLAGLAEFFLLLRVRTHVSRTHLGHWGGGLGCSVFGTGLVFGLAYIYGSPLLYGRGSTVPMAPTTALAFFMLGAAAVGASGREAIPIILLAGAKRASERMSTRARLLFLTVIMVTACAMVMAIMTVTLYRHDLREHRETLQVIAQSQARLIEAVARYDARMGDSLRNANPDHDSYAVTLSQIEDAHEHFEGFGETGEFTLARRDGDSIVFVLRHRHGAIDRPLPVAFDSNLAEPMSRALQGLSGTVMGLDYRGEIVLAAHEPVALLNLGIVAKIDMSEIRAPFIRAGLTAAAVAILVILAGVTLFFRIGNPIVERLQAYSRDLEKEIEERKGAQNELLVSNQALTMIGECNQALVHAEDTDDLLHNTCRALVEKGGYRLAWIGFAEPDEAKSVRPVAQMGYDEGYLDTLNITWADTERGRGLTSRAIRTGRPAAARRILTDPEFAPWRDMAIEHGYASSIALPLMIDERALGALSVYSSEPDAFNEEEVSRLLELADDVAYGIAMLTIREEHKRAEEELEKHHKHLENLVRERTVELEGRVAEGEKLNRAMLNLADDLRSVNYQLKTTAGRLQNTNKELESFAYSVSHDLRAPLRGIDGFSKALLEDYGEKLDQTGKDFLNRVCAATQRMGDLIDDLLELSRVTRSEFRDERVDLSAAVREIGGELRASAPDRSVKFIVQPGAVVEGDAGLLRLAMSNLLSNAWKFTRQREDAQVEFGSEECDGKVAYFVRDNGVGFEMLYADKLFGAFQRLHSTAEFPGTGIGLAIVQRVIHRHGGRVWAEGAVDRGATFYFTVGFGNEDR